MNKFTLNMATSTIILAKAKNTFTFFGSFERAQFLLFQLNIKNSILLKYWYYFILSSYDIKGAPSTST